MLTVTLCGSMKFEDEMRKIALELECIEGYNVLQCVYPVPEFSMNDAMLKNLKAAHFQKIDLSDAIYVVDIGGYIGESVREEMAYAAEHGKQVLYHSQRTQNDTESLKKLQEVLQNVENDRSAGKAGCTVDELESYLDDFLAHNAE